VADELIYLMPAGKKKEREREREREEEEEVWIPISPSRACP
jgi:hypothetical protein